MKTVELRVGDIVMVETDYDYYRAEILELNLKTDTYNTRRNGVKIQKQSKKDGKPYGVPEVIPNRSIKMFWSVYEREQRKREIWDAHRKKVNDQAIALTAEYKAFIIETFHELGFTVVIGSGFALHFAGPNGGREKIIEFLESISDKKFEPNPELLEEIPKPTKEQLDNV